MKLYLRIRYLFDWLFALALLPILIPLFFIISFIQFYVFEEVLFTQERSGLNGEIFTLFKFKTMNDDESKTETERIPAWGRFLRNSGLDELPQVLNILSGSMVFIGPRPLLPQYDNLYSTEHRKRLEIKPGITGYAQAIHRNNTSWQQRFGDDVFYVKEASLILDLEIIYKSVMQILSGKEQDILPPFDGSGDESTTS